MKRKRSVYLVGGLSILAIVAAFVIHTALTGPPTEEERVRAVLDDMIEAVLDEDFGEEWRRFARSAREHWSGQLAAWKELEAGSEKWNKLDAVHGLSRDDVLGMDVGEFFVACRAGRVHLAPEEWAAERELLRSLGTGEFELEEEGSAHITFKTHTDPETDIEQHVYRFVKEEGDWRFMEVGCILMALSNTGWDEPPLELAWARGAGQLEDERIALVVNLLEDGCAIAGGTSIDMADLPARVALAAEPGKHVVFRCDARVAWRVAAEWLGALVLAGARPIPLAVTLHEDVGCRRSRPPDREGMWFQTLEGRLDFHPPKEDVDPAEIDVVIDVGPVPASEADWGWLESHVAALSVDRSDTLVLVNPSQDAPWGATVRVLAAAAAGGAGQVLLANPGMDAFEGGVRWNGRPRPGGDFEGEHIPPAEPPPNRRVLGTRK